MAELIIYSGKLKGQRLILPDREVVIGRDEDCHMRIASSLISRKHCTLKAAPDGVWVRDLNSQNGTYVNDVAITDPFLMKPGDILRVGAALFQVPRLRPPSTKVSDDNITDWLTDESGADSDSSVKSDTTIIKGRQSAPPAAPATGAVAAPKSPVQIDEARPRPTIRQPPKTVKEQAADIIRKHWEIVRGEKPE
ncbi:MAG: FHA domain-containing protein [Planctomycetes bacterium]|nr:FHA domain-containing protein [Planctomycetota bacterium]